MNTISVIRICLPSGVPVVLASLITVLMMAGCSSPQSGPVAGAPAPTDSAAVVSVEVAPVVLDPSTPLVEYTVVKGDTLWGIANRHSTSVDAIKAASKLDSDTIRPGQKLMVPTTKEAAEAAIASRSAEPPPDETSEAVVSRSIVTEEKPKETPEPPAPPVPSTPGVDPPDASIPAPAPLGLGIDTSSDDPFSPSSLKMAPPPPRPTPVLKTP